MATRGAQYRASKGLFDLASRDVSQRDVSCGQWGKHTNFELGTRVPLIFHAAGQTTGLKSNTLVESLDICKLRARFLL